MAEEADRGEPAFVVVGGSPSGEIVPIDRGTHSVGRDANAQVRFADDGVSRSHAVIVRSEETVSLEDAGSTNGTWVNGTRIVGRQVLHPGDIVTFGTVALRFRSGGETPQNGAAISRTTQTIARRRRVSLTKIVLVAGLANLVILAAGVVIQFLTDWTGIGPWLAAPLTGMVAALVEAGREGLTRDRQAPPPEPMEARSTGSARATRPVPAQTRRGPTAVSIVLVVVLVGLGGVALAYGVATVSGYITGNQVGTDRLASEPVAVDAKGVVTTVEAVEQTRDFTRVDIVVQNNLANTVSLPLFHNAILSDSTVTLDADGFRSSWSETIAPGQQRRGSLVFVGHLAEGATTATLAFATVFEQGFDGPDSIVVPGLVLTAVE